MVEVLEDPSPSSEHRPLGGLSRNLVLPVTALTVAVFAAIIGFEPRWFEEWRTGVLIAVSAVVIVAGQAFLTQYFEARATRGSLLRRIREKRDEADALIRQAENRGPEGTKSESDSRYASSAS